MRTTPTPDIDGMLLGGQDRLRRRNTRRIGLAAAAVVLLGGGVYAVTQIGGDSDAGPGFTSTPSSEPTVAADPPPWPDNDQPVDPGTYRLDTAAADGTVVEADVTLGGSNWEGSSYPVAYDGVQFAGMGVYAPEDVAGGCRMQEGYKPAAAEPQQLVAQLAALPRSEIVQQPTATNAFGHSATHLRLRVNAACGPDAAYLVASSHGADRGISYFDATSQQLSGIVIIDFWVVDVDGTAVVVDRFRSEAAPKGLVDQAAAALESVTFLPAT